MSYRQWWLIALITTASALAQSTPDQIVDKFTEAVGGRAAYEKVTTRTMKGEVTIPDDNTTGTLEVYAKAPDRYRETTDFPGYGVVEMVLAGDKGWKKDPDAGVNSMSRTDITSNQRDHAFYMATRLKELFPKMEAAGTADVEGHSTNVISATPASGPAEKLYFDAASGFLVKHDFERITLEDGIVQYEVLYRDYRDVDGLKLPFTIEQRTPDGSMIVKFAEIKNNAEVADDRFQKPEK